MPPRIPRPPASTCIVASGITKGLKFAWIPASGKVGSQGGFGIDLATRTLATFPSQFQMVNGVPKVTSSGSAGAAFPRIDLKLTSPFTVFTYFRPTTTDAGPIVGNRAGNYGFEQYWFSGPDATGLRIGTGGGLDTYLYSGSGAAVGSWMSLCHVVTPTGSSKRVSGYANGSLFGTATITSDVSYTATNNDSFRLGGTLSQSGARAEFGAVYLWDRPLTPGEIRALDVDPYLFFRDNELNIGLIFTSSESTFEDFVWATRSGGAKEWANEANAKSDDGSFATTTGTVIGASDAWTHYLQATELTAAPSTESIILGIEIEVLASVTDDSLAPVPQLDAQLLLAGSTVGSLKVLTTTVGESETAFTFGGEADLWSSTLTSSDLNATDFGVQISFRIDNDPNIGFPIVSVDQIKARLTYLSSSAAPQSWTGSGTGAFAIVGTCAAIVSKAGAATGGIVLGGSVYGPITFGVAVSPGGIVLGASVSWNSTGSATGSFVIGGSASGQLITYWAQGGLVVTGTVASNQEVFAPQIIGGLAFAGTGGTPKLNARGSTPGGGIVLNGSVSGKRTTRGSAIGHFDGSGGVSGVVSGLMALGSGGVVISGSVAGLLSKRGSASGAFAISGSSSGVSHVETGAAGMFAMSGTITGRAIMRSGAAGGTVLSGSAKSVSRAFAGAIGSLISFGRASSVMSVAGAMKSGITVAGSASGIRRVFGATMPVLAEEIFDHGYNYNGPIFLISGSAAGQMKKEILVSKGGLVVEGMANARRNRFGLVYGGITVSGTSAGHVVRVGAATGSITISGSINGRVSRYGAVLAGITVAGTIIGLTTRRGAAVGRFALGGSVIFPLIEFDGATAWSVDCELQQVIRVDLAHVIDVSLTLGDPHSID